MAYKVVKRFKDTKHDSRVYEVGDIYPAEGFKSTKTRTDELASEKNKYKTPFLEEVKSTKKTKE